MTGPLPRRELSPGMKLAIDYGPLLAFFAINFLVPGLPLVRLMAATAAFILAISIAIGLSLAKTGRVSPMLLLTGVLVIVFGGLTLWFRDAYFIQLKPTIIYGLLALLLAFGLVTDRPLLQQVLGDAYPGLTPLGWRKLTINWTLFFIALAVLNEIVRRNFSQDFWVGFKLWGVVPLTILFAAANVPMLMKHGLQTEPDPGNVD
ncbi:septation protein A [Sphingomonas sp. GlSt437]|uniref:septation protein A n=1 Tax=Sphingomonas sp. GlSt437 TaxID=3389970 RepID=UPI003A889886